MFLNRLYKYKRPATDAENQKSGQLLIRFEKGEWIIRIAAEDNDIIALEWLETGEFLDEQTMQSYLEKFLKGLLYDSDNVHLVICGEQFQFMPSGFTSENEEWAVLLNNVDHSADRLITEPFDAESKIELIYTVPESLICILNTVVGIFNITHQAVLYYKENSAEFTREAVNVCLYKNYALVQAIINHETFFLKRINWKTQEDLLFEIMSIYKHFSMEPSEIPLYTGGMITKDSPVFNLLMRYIKEVEIKQFKSFHILSQLPDLHESHLIEKV
ncbi:MAG: DUF3822 family protein [Saprospiraceae bacterium]|nr:DUF3822 family protein [Saprospiraceae bacterium]